MPFSEGGLGETALWAPKSGFPQKSYSKTASPGAGFGAAEAPNERSLYGQDGIAGILLTEMQTGVRRPVSGARDHGGRHGLLLSVRIQQIL